jgi:hypothetical protein
MSKTRANSGQITPNIVLQGATGIVIPVGNTLERSGTPQAGEIRYNSEIGIFEGYTGSVWGSFGPYPTQSIEYFTGDGVTVEFDLDNTVLDTNAVIVTLNGVQLRYSVDFTFINSGTTIRFEEADATENPPLEDSEIAVRIFSPITSATVPANTITPAELAVSPGTEGQYLSVDQYGNLQFLNLPNYTADPSLGGDLEGTVSAAQIKENAVSIRELDVSDGLTGQVLATDGTGNLTFITVPGLSNNALTMQPLAVAPIVNEGTIVVADGVSWNPASKVTNKSYPVYFDGTSWNALY